MGWKGFSADVVVDGASPLVEVGDVVNSLGVVVLVVPAGESEPPD